MPSSRNNRRGKRRWCTYSFNQTSNPGRQTINLSSTPLRRSSPHRLSAHIECQQDLVEWGLQVRRRAAQHPASCSKQNSLGLGGRRKLVQCARRERKIGAKFGCTVSRWYLKVSPGQLAERYCSYHNVLLPTLTSKLILPHSVLRGLREMGDYLNLRREITHLAFEIVRVASPTSCLRRNQLRVSYQLQHDIRMKKPKWLLRPKRKLPICLSAALASYHVVWQKPFGYFSCVVQQPNG